MCARVCVYDRAGTAEAACRARSAAGSMSFARFPGLPRPIGGGPKRYRPEGFTERARSRLTSSRALPSRHRKRIYAYTPPAITVVGVRGGSRWFLRRQRCSYGSKFKGTGAVNLFFYIPVTRSR